MTLERKTPLYARHEALGGKIVPFAGHLLPVQYRTGVIAEHMAVRERAGLFDVSHMGEILLTGPGAFANLQMLLTNDYTTLADGRVRYSPMCNAQGGVVDDLIVYRFGPESCLLVVNASNREKDVAWMNAHLTGNATLEDISEQVAQIALQGPASRGILEKLAEAERLPVKYYSFTANMPVAGLDCLVSRTGYTGEDGFELYCAPQDATQLWDALLDAGKGEGLIPCGLGARDTLRLEASMPLYGHEMDENITPRETGLGMFVKMGKEDFIGKAALLEQGEPARCRVGLSIIGRGIVRENCPVYQGERQVGVTTSGTHCPYLGRPAAMALVERGAAALGSTVEAEVRGRRVAAEVVPLPFYKRG